MLRELTIIGAGFHLRIATRNLVAISRPNTKGSRPYVTKRSAKEEAV